MSNDPLIKKNSKNSPALVEDGKSLVGPTIYWNGLIVVGKGKDEGTGIIEGRLDVEVDDWITLAIEGHEKEKGRIVEVSEAVKEV